MSISVGGLAIATSFGVFQSSINTIFVRVRPFFTCPKAPRHGKGSGDLVNETRSGAPVYVEALTDAAHTRSRVRSRAGRGLPHANRRPRVHRYWSLVWDRSRHRPRPRR